MTRWHPSTLKARIILILCSVLVFSQTINLLIFVHNRDQVILNTEATDLSDRIIGIVNLAYSFPEQDRQQILAAAETQFLAMFPTIVSVQEVACQDTPFARQMSRRLNDSFAALAGVDAEVCVRTIDESRLLTNTPLVQQGVDVLIFINFPNNDQTIFHAVLPEGSPLLDDALFAYILIAGLIALSLAWYLIRKSVAPIEHLANAADRIGVNIDNPPLDEDGPLEVALAAKAFNRMQTRLAKHLHGQTQMLAAISHDLRSAVTRLQLRAELLTDKQQRHGMLQVVSDMRQMTQSVLEFARGQESNEAMRRVNIAALVESLCEDMLDEGFSIDYRCSDNTINLECRTTEIRRGLQNIVDNAIKYAGHANVSLSREYGATPEEDYAVIRVEDDGPGIPDAQIDYVMQPFHRLEQSRNPQTGGIGLGLSITQNIVQGHGGLFKLESRPEGGLRAEIYLPIKT